MTETDESINKSLAANLAKNMERIADSLEKITQLGSLTQGQKSQSNNSLQTYSPSNCFVFDAAHITLSPVTKLTCPSLTLLKGIDRARDTLLDNTKRFADGYSANNALLWGARGMGKSTLVKSVFNDLFQSGTKDLNLIEIHREDIASLPSLLKLIKKSPERFIIFCDDLSFNQPDRDFKALKSVLEGGLEGRPENVIFYATSNRRHLLPRAAVDQETATGLHPNEAMDEVIALSDRFGLWLGFYPCDQADYLTIIEGYLAALKIDKKVGDWQPEALEWAKARGSRSGRAAWQFVTDLAGNKSLKISL